MANRPKTIIKIYEIEFKIECECKNNELSIDLINIGKKLLME